MKFLTKWRVFAWLAISSPIWLLAPLVVMIGATAHFPIFMLLLWMAAVIYIGPHKLLRCPECNSSMLSWRKAARGESGGEQQDPAALQVYLLLSLFSSKLAASYLGDLHCPRCGYLLHKQQD